MSTELIDEEQRETIRTRTGATLFVNAGAGSGKTQAMVSRVRKLVIDDDIELKHIAAVTFTEKAGTELQDRLREEFEDAASSGTVAQQERAEVALADLDAAAIGTLHSFAQRILTAYPIEAGIPPLLERLDEVASSVAFDERWGDVRATLLDDDSVADALIIATSLGVSLDGLRDLMQRLTENWDLIDERILAGPESLVENPDTSSIVDDINAIADLHVHEVPHTKVSA